MLLLAQNKIVLNDNKVLDNVRLHKIYLYKIEYEKEGSLHDLLIDKIKYIKLNADTMITFNGNIPIYKNLSIKETYANSISPDSSIVKKQVKTTTPFTDTITNLVNSKTENIDVIKNACLKIPSINGIIKFFPLSLLEPESSVQIGCEIPITKDFALEGSLGHYLFIPGLSIDFLNNKTLTDLKGINTKLEFKWYCNENLFNPKNALFNGDNGFYFAGQMMFKQVHSTYSYEAYQYYDHYEKSKITVKSNVYKDVFVLNAKMGYQIRIYSNFIIDIYAGGGIRQKAIKTTYEPKINSYLTNNNRTSEELPNVTAGFKLGWIF